MQRKAFLAAIAACAVAIAPVGASAQSVYCTNCSTIYTQLLQQAAEAETLINSAAQLQQQISQYANMLQNTAKLPATLFGSAMQDIQRLNNIVSQAKGIAYNASNLEDQFKVKFGSLDSYLKSGMTQQSYQSKLQQWSDDTSDNVLTTLKAVKSQSDSFDDEASLMEDLQSQAESADGQMKALSVGNELGVQTVGQLQKLRQLLMAQIAMQAQSIQTDQDKQDAAQARARSIFSSADPAYSGQTY